MSEHDGMSAEEMAIHIREHHKGMIPMVFAVEPWVVLLTNRLMEEGDLDIAADVHGSAVFIFSDSPTPVVVFNESAEDEDWTPEAGTRLAIGAADENSAELHQRVIAIVDELQAENDRRVQADLDRVLDQIVNPDS